VASPSSSSASASSLQLATGLLPDLAVREAGDPDRGRWPLWLRLMTALTVGVAAAGAAGLLARTRERVR
jgi:hypothetical protein